MKQSVTLLQAIEPEIALITMQDKINKNTFSPELIFDLKSAFESVENNSSFKVVILTGYDNYFATGGTQDSLLALHEGKVKFNDVNIYSLALNCRIPVIAAMQGHGIGGGFVMGLFADFVILSRESIYSTNFMKYGFTPGMGATFILEQKLGVTLAHELLLVAGNYRGADLAKRGVSFPVLPREEVLSHAIQLAKQLAEKPRLSLITLKDHLVSSFRKQLPEIIEQEVLMHEKQSINLK